jgi:hypothetical protein
LVKIGQKRANALKLAQNAVVLHPGSKGDHCGQEENIDDPMKGGYLISSSEPLPRDIQDGSFVGTYTGFAILEECGSGHDAEFSNLSFFRSPWLQLRTRQVEVGMNRICERRGIE